MLVTAETYSKYIHPTDRSLRTIFGDGAAATLIEAADEPSLGGFVFGTDGRGGDTLMVTEGGARPAAAALQPRKRKRWPSALVMDGPEIVKFTLEVVPPMIERVLGQSRWTRDDVEFYLMHQATYFMLEHLRVRLELTEAQIPLALQEYGNTVSSTLPLLMHDMRCDGRLRPGTQNLLISFGVGLSWAGCSWIETWQPRRTSSAAAAGRGEAADPLGPSNGRSLPDAGGNGRHVGESAPAPRREGKAAEANIQDQSLSPRPLSLAYSIAPYASVQKSVKTFGGSGDSIMRCVKRMPIIASRGSVYAEVPKPPSQPNRPGVRKTSLRRVSTAMPKPQLR